MAALLMNFHSSPGRAAGIEKLLMPGPVSAAHAKVEERCEACHDRRNVVPQSSLCLACHKDVAADLRAATGFHGRLRGGRDGECRACHGEHHGRTADIVGLDRTTFDHERTGFALEGAHSTLACGDCHRTEAHFREAPAGCIGCHRTDDAHHGNLGTDCKSCHAVSAWQAVRFDHDKTRFALTGKHRELPCAACHAAERFRGASLQCASCHAPEDVHRGSRGARCADCHTTADWKIARFDHAKETGFALLGSHARLACSDCHRSGNLKDPLPKTCAGCHRADDRHAGRFGMDCGTCHGTEAWRIEHYDHAGRHRFALTGPHAGLDCHACHTAVASEQKLPTSCGDCHRQDDVHGGALGTACESCHLGAKWSADVRFDHDLSAFPLVGLHVVATCAQCHASKRFRDTPKNCSACHSSRDVHHGSLGPDCAGCHSPNGWNLWVFDHSRTRFPLTGAHSTLRCSDCHVKRAGEVKLSRDCGTCHASEDVHDGQFGRHCDRCHDTITFRNGRAT